MKEAKTTGELMIDPLGMGQCGGVRAISASQGLTCIASRENGTKTDVSE